MTEISKNVATYNLFLTTDGKVAADFATFQADPTKSYGSFMQKHANAGVFLSTTKNNNTSQFPIDSGVNILEFIHAFNSKGKNSENEMILKTYEPGLEILKKLFFLQLGDRMTKIKEIKSLLETAANDLEQDPPRSFVDEQLAAGVGSVAEVINLYQQTEQAISESEKVNKLLNSQVQGVPVFIAYGVGDNFKYWAGPYQSYLGRIEYSNDGRKETISYYFSPDHVSRQFDEEANLPGVINTNYVSPGVPIAAWNRSSKADVIREGEAVKFGSFTPSVHDCIVKAISRYLYDLGIKNHLIVLPNLDKLLEPFIINQLGFISYLDQSSTKQYTRQELQEFNYAGATYHDKLGLMGRGLFEGYKGVTGSKDPEPDRQPTTKINMAVAGIERVFESLGLQIGIRENQSTDVLSQIITNTNPEYLTTDRDQMEDIAIAKNIPVDPNSGFPVDIINDPFSHAAADFNHSAEVVQTLKLPFGMFEVQDDAGNVTGTSFDKKRYMEPIIKILDRVLASAGGDAFMSPVHFWEQDIKVNQLLMEKFGSGTYSGYSELATESDTPGFTRSKGWTSPWRWRGALHDNFFIVGDRDLIDKFVYGAIGSISTYQKEFRDASYLFRTAVPVYASPTSEYFSDPFWTQISKDLKKVTTQGTTQDVYEESYKSTYFSKMHNVVLGLKKPSLGFFNDNFTTKEGFVSVLPDEFALINEARSDLMTHSILDQIYDFGLPWFMANQKNSNVLSYNFDADNFLLNQFYGSIADVYRSVGLRYTQLAAQGNIVNGYPSSDDVQAELYGILDSMRSRGWYGIDANELFGRTPTVSMAKLTNDLKDIFLLETPGTHRTVAKGRYSATVALVKLFSGLYDSYYKGRIKTLPMFHLSNMGSILKPAVVSLKSTPKIDLIPQSDLSTQDFFSGLYKILGFKHVINQKNPTSEFLVIKDLAGELQDADE